MMQRNAGRKGKESIDPLTQPNHSFSPNQSHAFLFFLLTLSLLPSIFHTLLSTQPNKFEISILFFFSFLILVFTIYLRCLCFYVCLQLSVYPKVKVRHDDDAELGLKAFVSLYLHPSSPVTDNKVVSMPTVVKVPECYVPHVAIPRPRVHVTEDSEDFSLASDSSVTTGSEKDDSIDGSKVNIRASPIPPPRAVISSPDNDIMIGNRNKTRDGRLSASKNGAMLQNRHAHCKVKSHDVTDIPPETRKHSEPGSKEEIDSVGKKKTHKGRIKFEKVPWKF